MAIDLPVRRWLNVILPVGAISLLIALILPAIQQAREAARRTQSRNNLKQWALAIVNYESTDNLLPLGGSVDPDGVGHHGWATRLVPYLAQTMLFNEFDFNQPWDSPRNESFCREDIWDNLNPGIESPIRTPEGYSVLHYEANPSLFHRNHCASSKEMSNGASETWLLGEASGDFHPWAYPYNWRPLGTRLNDRETGFGRLNQQVTSLAMADGSVRAVNQDIDPTVLKQLANAPPLAMPEQVLRPPTPTPYRYSGNEREFSIRQGGDYWPWVYINRRKGIRDVEIWASGKGHSSDMSPPSRDLVRDLTLNQTPATTSLAGPVVLNDTMMAIVSRLDAVHTLQVDRVEATPGVIEGLQAMKSLKLLQSRWFADGAEAAIQRAMPSLQIGPNSRDFGFRDEK